MTVQSTFLTWTMVKVLELLLHVQSLQAKLQVTTTFTNFSVIKKTIRMDCLFLLSIKPWTLIVFYLNHIQQYFFNIKWTEIKSSNKDFVVLPAPQEWLGLKKSLKHLFMSQTLVFIIFYSSLYVDAIAIIFIIN